MDLGSGNRIGYVTDFLIDISRETINMKKDGI